MIMWFKLTLRRFYMLLHMRCVDKPCKDDANIDIGFSVAPKTRLEIHVYYFAYFLIILTICLEFLFSCT